MTINDIDIRHWLSEGKTEMAFRSIVRQTSPSLYRMIRKMTGSHTLTDDILQNIYLRVFEKIGDFEWRSSLSTWIYRIAVNEVLQCLRSERRHQTSDLSEVELSNGPDIDYDAWMERFEKVVSELPDRQRMVFVLRYFEDMSYREISRIMDRSEGGLKANYHHAVQKIRGFIERNIVT